MDKKVKGEIIKSGNIVLSGFMGSGKTTVGRRLAAALDMQFVDIPPFQILSSLLFIILHFSLL